MDPNSQPNQTLIPNQQSIQHARQMRIARLARRIAGEGIYLWMARRFYGFKIHGEGHIPTTGPCIFAMNHQSLLSDALVFLVIRCHHPQVGVFGWQNLAGESPSYESLAGFGEQGLERRFLRAYKAAGLSSGELLKGYHALRQGGTLLVAVEGELTWDGRLQYPLAPGAAWLALRTGAPLVPLVMRGGYDIQPRWRLEKIQLFGRLSLHISKPRLLSASPLQKVSQSDLRAANDHLWQALAALLKDN